MSINPNPVLTFDSDFVDSGSSAVDRITNDVNFSLVVAGLGAGDSVAYQYSTDAGNSWIATAASQSNLADGSYQVRALITYESGYRLRANLALAIGLRQLMAMALLISVNLHCPLLCLGQMI